MSLNTEHLQRCVQTLESALVLLEQSPSDSIEYEVFRNAVVKGFELTLETSVKLLRKTLKLYFSSSKAVDQLTFKDAFRHAAKHDLLTGEEVERWFIYRDNSNNTAHDYGERFAETTLVLMPGFVEDAKRLEERLARGAD
ncbi:MAG: nucleotidyltransferase substrate binding protein [Candidatus Hydrogenedentes bacterium]|nr:nucleotidyltransferase substrate binding protein [Candidatus Hydrogenedentota bacterium]